MRLVSRNDTSVRPLCEDRPHLRVPDPATGHPYGRRGLPLSRLRAEPILTSRAPTAQHQIPLFSLQDMRLFQHFLMHCYPHHPIGAGSLWTHEIPCLSEKVCVIAT